MDTNWKRYHWSQWLVIAAFIYYIIFIFRDKYIYIGRVGLNVTLFVLLTMFVQIYNTVCVFGLSTSPELKTSILVNVIPIGVLIVEFLILYLIKNGFPVQVNWIVLLKNLMRYTLLSVACIIFHSTNEITVISVDEALMKGED